MPMEALVLFGFFGFSSNSYIVPSGRVFMIPKRDASAIGTSRTAMVQSASFCSWKRSIRA